MATETVEIVETDTDGLILPYYEDEDDAEHLAHIVSPPENLHITDGDPGLLAQDIVDMARTLEIEVIALCGYQWIPKRNPDKYPACQQCMDLAAMIMQNLGE